MTEDDIDLMAESGAIAVLNPESNACLGTGVARIPDMQRRGVTLALGTDGASANDNLVLQRDHARGGDRAPRQRAGPITLNYGAQRATHGDGGRPRICP